MFYYVFHQIIAALVRISDFPKKLKQFYIKLKIK